MKNKVAIILKGYPRLSETFIAQEILSLQKLGLNMSLVSLRHPTDKTTHPIHDEINAPVNYLPEYLYQEPGRVWRAWRAGRRRAGYRAARKTWLRDLLRDKTPNRIRRFGQALVLAHELSRDTDWIYAHFLHTPASVARYAAMIRELPWSCSAHAKDIYTSPDWEITEKLAHLSWLVTCTRANVDHLKSLAKQYSDKIYLLYHGLDLDRFPAAERTVSENSGQQGDAPVFILSVGRAVEKKGYDVLLNALSRLPENLHWRLIHVGGGALLEKLKRQARDLGISDLIEWRGALPQREILDLYRDADMFVLASRIAADGDRDGLPNVLMEAQSQGLPCVSTNVSAVPELIRDGVTGKLVEPEDVGALTSVITELVSDPAQRRSLGDAARQRVRSEFSHASGMTALAGHFGLLKQVAAE